MKVHVDTGSSVDIIYEQCFRKLPESIKAELIPTAVSLSGFVGEFAWTVGQLPLKIELVDETDAKLMRLAWLDLYVMRSASCYNKLLGCYALSKFGIIPSIIHRMIKFATCKGVAIMISVVIQPICATVNTQGTVIESAGAENNMVMINCAYLEQEIKIGNNLNAEVKKQLVQLLIANMDVFAWCEQDICALIFKDINKACPKDNYPLPEIDWKVESLHEYPFNCFLDAYKGYHKIPMAKEDEDKTTFHTGKGIYCYIKMPFGLKNDGATYQRLIDSAFESQIGRNLEAYVDDLVIKRKTQDQILQDVAERFENMQKINMNLNQSKCCNTPA
ncbi:uncharacterized protein [Rutidosis leptorrhynchoides]|uniref:uncharacterized protein n=1 Tax=Rutidosis leptorrhynchoides TaxID=125765 RepID=UPI003A9A0A7B